MLLHLSLSLLLLLQLLMLLQHVACCCNQRLPVSQQCLPVSQHCTGICLLLRWLRGLRWQRWLLLLGRWRPKPERRHQEQQQHAMCKQSCARKQCDEWLGQYDDKANSMPCTAKCRTMPSKPHKLKQRLL
jgi:hypothetical protein